jgi:hypothetical protein
MTEHKFRVFGLVVSSCIFCPELVPGDGEVDATVTYGTVPEPEPSRPPANPTFWYEGKPGQLFFHVQGIGRYLVRDGKEIVIDRASTATDDDIRVFLLGSAFGALLHQRGYVVLHGSIVKISEEACAVIVGHSGAGKSTLAAVLSRRGYQCLGDDVCAVSFGEDGTPFVKPAYPQTKLAEDALAHLGIDAEPLRRARPARPKRVLPLSGKWQNAPLRLDRIYVLSQRWPGATLMLKPISGSNRFRALCNYTYRWEYLRGLGLALQNFKQLAHLAARIPLIRAIRPTEGFVVEELATAIQNDLRASGATVGEPRDLALIT